MNNNIIPDILVVGTDTGVGKTVVSLLLMQYLYTQGYKPFYLKPFQTGCHSTHDKDSDARFVYQHTAELKTKAPSASMIYCHPNPKAPYFAAIDAGETISLQMITEVVIQKRKHHSPLVIEAAGGLLVPIVKNFLVIDTIKMLNCRPLLVARAGLGTINHTLLSIEALQHRQISLLGIILMDHPDVPADSDLVKENLTAIEMFSGIRPSGVIKPITNFSRPPEIVFEIIGNLLNTDLA